MLKPGEFGRCKGCGDYARISIRKELDEMVDLQTDVWKTCGTCGVTGPLSRAEQEYLHTMQKLHEGGEAC